MEPLIPGGGAQPRAAGETRDHGRGLSGGSGEGEGQGEGTGGHGHGDGGEGHRQKGATTPSGARPGLGVGCGVVV